jgi:hypothetical protein
VAETLMAGIHVGELPDGTKRCVVCAEPINAAAVKCVHCGGDQTVIRQRIGVSTNVLSMMVALVSVMGVVVPLLIQSATPDDSSLIFSLQYATDKELFVIVSNQGKEPGTVATAHLLLKDGKSVQLRSSEFAPVEVVDPKKSILLRFHKFVFEGKHVPPEFVFEAPTDRPCLLSLDVTSFRGERSAPVIERPCGEFAPFVKPT